MFYNEPEYLRIIQMTPKQRECLGQMLYATGGNMRAMSDGKMQYYGTGRPDGITRRTYNSLVDKGAIVGDDLTGRPAYENAYVRAEAAQAAKEIAEVHLARTKRSIIDRVGKLTNGGTRISGDSPDWIARTMSAINEIPFVADDTRLPAYLATYIRLSIMVARLGDLSDIDIFAGLDKQAADLETFNLRPQHLSRLKWALKGRRTFTTGFVNNGDISFMIVATKENLHAYVSIEGVTETAEAVNDGQVATVTRLLEEALKGAEEQWEWWSMEQSGYDYSLDY